MDQKRRLVRPPMPRPAVTPDFNYKDLDLLQKYIGPQGQIMHRKRTSLTARGQRELKQAIKRARHLGLLPFVG